MLRTVFALLLMMKTLSGHASQFVVIESTATKFAVGALLEPQFNLELSNREKLTLISEAGELHVMTGPYRGSLSTLQSQSNDPASIGLVLGRILSERSDDLRTLGTVRRLGASVDWFLTHNNQAWNLISAEHDGVQCVVSGQPIQLVRKMGNSKSLRSYGWPMVCINPLAGVRGNHSPHGPNKFLLKMVGFIC